MAYKITVQPEEPVLPLPLLRAQCRILVAEGNTHPEDALLLLALASARRVAQHATGTAIGEQTIELSLDAFPAGPLALPLGPFVRFVDLRYVAPDLSVQTVPLEQLVVDDHDPAAAWLMPALAAHWPQAAAVVNAVTVRYVAGHVPDAVRQAMLLLVAHYYRNRQAVSDRQTHQLMLGVDTLFGVDKVWSL